MAIKSCKKLGGEIWYGTNAERLTLLNVGVGDEFFESDTRNSFKYVGDSWVAGEEFSSIAKSLLVGEKISEIQIAIAKNTLQDVETAKVLITKPVSPLLTYKASMYNPSIDSDVKVKLFNRRTFTEFGIAFEAGSDGTHIQLSALANPTNDFYNTFVVTITAGTGVGQVRTISDYVGSTQIAQVTPAWTTALDDTSAYSIAMVVDSLAWTGTFAKASLTAPIIKANDSILINGLFDDDSDVYLVASNLTAIPNADASRFTAVFQLIAVG